MNNIHFYKIVKMSFIQISVIKKFRGVKTCSELIRINLLSMCIPYGLGHVWVDLTR
jgi:hypothetical protein